MWIPTFVQTTLQVSRNLVRPLSVIFRQKKFKSQRKKRVKRRIEEVSCREFRTFKHQVDDTHSLEIETEEMDSQFTRFC